MSSLLTPVSESRFELTDKLLKQLLECVQECQKRYGGRKELATEYDSCVVALCITLETVLTHGIRSKTLPQSSGSALHQVSTIVSNSLHLVNESDTFWLLLQVHLTKHERERYNSLKHIWTNTGRCRAWIRATLNERSLERYFHCLLSNSEVLKNYYEDHAILRDPEKSSMLPNMAAGLGAILFAINIDKPELNSGIPQRIEKFKLRPEPIIEAPITENKNQKKSRRRKVARQLIDFKDDETIVLPTEVASPSHLISIPLDNNHLNGNNILEEEMLQRKSLTLEASNNTLEVPKVLTPITYEAIGELTPVSTEIKEDSDVSSGSNDIEIPTDISEVLGTVEEKYEQELKTKQEKINSLCKENEMLKQQVNNYISTIKMLQDEDDDIEEDLSNLDISEKPNYKVEAKLFEKKLVQVAEMHAELIDFNVNLQQSLCQRDLLLERLKLELERLRGPIPNYDLASINQSVNVWIPSAFLTGSGSTAHHVYQIFLRAGNDEWNIYRRYAQFHTLHSDLRKLDPAVNNFNFPPKKSMGKKDSVLVEDRRKRLQSYLRRILSYWPELYNCNSRFLLEQHLSFFKEQKDESPKNKNVFFPKRSRNDDNHYAGL